LHDVTLTPSPVCACKCRSCSALVEMTRKLQGRKCSVVSDSGVLGLNTLYNPITIPKCSYNVYPAEIRIDES